MNNKIIDSFLK